VRGSVTSGRVEKVIQKKKRGNKDNASLFMHKGSATDDEVTFGGLKSQSDKAQAVVFRKAGDKNAIRGGEYKD